MENKVDFPEKVILIDAVELNDMVVNFKRSYEKLVKRPLPKMDVSQLVVSLALDAKFPINDKEVQVILVYDETLPRLEHAVPADFKNELDGVAFREFLGEFTFSSLSSEALVPRETMYLDLLRMIGESPNVKHIIALPSEDDVEMIHSELEKIKGKEVTWFGLYQLEKDKVSYNWGNSTYAVMEALGIRGDELASPPPL